MYEQHCLQLFWWANHLYTNFPFFTDFEHENNWNRFLPYVVQYSKCRLTNEMTTNANHYIIGSPISFPDLLCHQNIKLLLSSYCEFHCASKLLQLRNFKGGKLYQAFFIAAFRMHNRSCTSYSFHILKKCIKHHIWIENYYCKASNIAPLYIAVYIKVRSKVMACSLSLSQWI